MFTFPDSATYLRAVCASLAELAMHFSEFLAQETLHVTWETCSSSLLCTFPRSAKSIRHGHRPQLEPRVLQLLLGFPFNFSALWIIMSIPGLPAGLPYGGEWNCEMLAWAVVPACLSFMSEGIFHWGLSTGD